MFFKTFSTEKRVGMLTERLRALQRLRDEHGERAEIAGVRLDELIVTAQKELEEAREGREDVKKGS